MVSHTSRGLNTVPLSPGLRHHSTEHFCDGMPERSRTPDAARGSFGEGAIGAGTAETAGGSGGEPGHGLASTRAPSPCERRPGRATAGLAAHTTGNDRYTRTPPPPRIELVVKRRDVPKASKHPQITLHFITFPKAVTFSTYMYAGERGDDLDVLSTGTGNFQLAGEPLFHFNGMLSQWCYDGGGEHVPYGLAATSPVPHGSRRMGPAAAGVAKPPLVLLR